MYAKIKYLFLFKKKNRTKATLSLQSLVKLKNKYAIFIRAFFMLLIFITFKFNYPYTPKVAASKTVITLTLAR